jgi:4-amino-4-deoxy-L-arabinose transferase-like glycosyltransferase
MPVASLGAPVPWALLGGLVLVRLGVWFASSGPLAYGYMSDEFYYLECAARLGWGYVDHPPLSVALLAGVRALFGDSLPALRLAPALAHCAAVVLSALIGRELGGGRTAQGLGALATLALPVFLGVTGFYSMNALEPVLWGAAVLLLARALRMEQPGNGLWLALGLVLGLGLLNKISTLWLGAALGLGLIATPQRRWLATPGPWLCAALAAALFAPHVVWQVQHGWTTLEFIRNAAEQKMVSKAPWTFALEQAVLVNPLLLPFLLGGLAYYFVSPSGRRFQLLAWLWIGVFLILALGGKARANYLAPAYMVLLPATGLAVVELARAWQWRVLPGVAATIFVVSGAGSAPLAIELLPPARYMAYQRTLGIAPPVEQVDELGDMPLHFALRFGWPELIGALQRAQDTLTPEEREQAVVFAPWFGLAGAVNFFGPAAGLPRAISGHNHYWLWGPGDASGDVLLTVAEPGDGPCSGYADVTRAAEIDCEYCMPDVSRMAIYVCRGRTRPVADLWEDVKVYQ